MMNTVKKYFILSDSAGKDPDSLNELISLFADDAVVEDNRNNIYRGIDEVSSFFHTFFKRNAELRHVFTIQQQDNIVKVQWGVVGKKPNNEIFTLTGTDIATLDDQQKIIHLQVIGND